MIAFLGRALAGDRPLGRGWFALAAVALLVLKLGLRVVLLPQALTFLQLFDPEVVKEIMRLWMPLLVQDASLLVWLALDLVTSWLIVMFGLRRAADAGRGQFAAVLAMIPLLLVPAAAYLCLLPSRPVGTSPVGVPVQGDTPSWPDAVLAVLVGALLTVAMVAVGGLLLGTYQYGLFVLTPFLIGVVAGYLVNRHGDRGLATTTKAVGLSTLAGSVALVSFAIEGLICIAVIAPLGFAVAWLGALAGRAAARTASWGRMNVGGAVAALLMVLALESLAQREAAFELRSTIDIDAPPAAVWRALVRMQPIAEAPALPFRLGVAYPMSASLSGEGVGAIRRGEFSTGTAIEQIVAWQPEVELAYRVLNEPPTMRELSFHEVVHAPHVHGYFTTGDSRFSLERLPGARTRLSVTTQHALRLEPSAYWLPVARWAVRENHGRVLRHIRSDAQSQILAPL